MKIVKVISGFYPVVGGGEKQAERLARTLACRGHEVTVLTRRPSPAVPEVEILDGIKVIRFPGSDRWRSALGMLDWIRCHRGSIDVLHAHQSNSPVVVTSIGSWLWGIPSVCTPMTRSPELAWVDPCLSTRPRRWLFSSTGAWIAKSEEIAQVLDQYAPTRVHRIPNGVDASQYSPAPRKEKLGLPTVIFVGRLERPKRVDLLLEAWRDLGNHARLLIVGDGSLRGELQEQAEHNELTGVEFMGNRTDVPHLLANSDIFALSSDAEGMPNSLLEAMSCALPCVATGVGAVPSMLEGVGCVVPPGDNVALRNALEGLVFNAALRLRLGQASRERVMAEYSLTAVVDHVENLYRHLIRRQSRG